MKVSSLLYYLISTITVGLTHTYPFGTIEQANKTLSIAQRDKDTSLFNLFEPHKAGLMAGKRYVFTLKWDNKVDDPKAKPELVELRKELGFCHIAVYVGDVSEKIIKKPKEQFTQRNIEGSFHHLIKDDKLAARYDFQRFTNDKAGRKDMTKREMGLTIDYVKETKQTNARITTWGE